MHRNYGLLCPCAEEPRCDSIFRRGRSGQNDGAEDERGGRKKEDKRNRGENVSRGNQRTGANVESKAVGMCAAIGSLTVNVQVMKMGEKLQGLQEEKHQLFLQLKKVLHEEEKRRRKEQRYSGDHSAPPLWHQLQFLLSFPAILRH